MSLAIFNQPDSVHLVSALGYAGIAAIVFAETGLIFCFFLPGDSLLFTAGMLAATHQIFNIAILIPLLIVASFLGYMLGYWVGYYFGHALSKRGDTWYYKKSYADKSHLFMQKYGKLALLYGRLVSVIRTFIPLIAGMGEMPLRQYIIFNFLGATIWCVTVPLLGFYLGRLIPDITDYLIVIVIGIVTVTVLPGIIEWWKSRRKT